MVNDQTSVELFNLNKEIKSTVVPVHNYPNGSTCKMKAFLKVGDEKIKF